MSQEDHLNRKIKYYSQKEQKLIETSIVEFYKLTGVQILSELVFSDVKVYEAIKKLIQKKLLDKKISIRAISLGEVYREEITTGFMEDVYIKRVNNRKGLGLFANKNLKAGTFIGEYLGIVRKCSLLFANVNEYCFRYPLYRIGLNVFTIDAHDSCNETSFINHSDQANCIAIVVLVDHLLHVCIFTKHAVKKDEELSYDYGNSLWKLDLG